jgi:hypothetical protein
MVQIVRFSMARVARGKNCQFQRGLNVLWSQTSVSACCECVFVNIIRFLEWLECVVVYIISFSISGMCCSQNLQFQHVMFCCQSREFQHVRNILWLKRSVSAWLEWV